MRQVIYNDLLQNVYQDTVRGSMMVVVEAVKGNGFSEALVLAKITCRLNSTVGWDPISGVGTPKYKEVRDFFFNL